MKGLLLKISMVLLSIHSLNCQNKIDYDCLDGLWQRMSLRSSSNEKFYDIFHNNNWISIYSCNYKDSLYLQINTYKFGYVDLKRDSVDVNIIINHGKYYVETEYAKSKTNKAKVLFINEDYSISCDEESYNWTMI